MFEKSMEYLAPFHTVGNYRLVEYISPCQNGDVFIAVSKRDKTQKYVLKILRRKEFTENGMFKMLERESRIQGFMKSDKIVRSYETIYTDEYIVLVLEYCANGDLISYLKKQMNLPFIEKVRILANLAEALEYMHNRNVVHRDIKLDNIFMDANNNAKLGDFGCCEITTENISHYYDACGTLHYTAPEILNSKLSKVDITKCDIWSFGIVAFTLLTNRFPWKSTKDQDIYYEIYNFDRIHVPSFVHPEIADIIRMCCEKSPELRPTASDLVTAISVASFEIFTKNQITKQTPEAYSSRCRRLLSRPIPNKTILSQKQFNANIILAI